MQATKHSSEGIHLGFETRAAITRSPKQGYHCSGGYRGGRSPYSPKFSQFHAVFRKIWQNHMLAPPLEGWRPPYGESWSRPCIGPKIKDFFMNKNTVIPHVETKSVCFRWKRHKRFLNWKILINLADLRELENGHSLFAFLGRISLLQ